MRRILLAGACLLALSGGAHAQIPVTDVIGDASWGTQLIDFGKSLEQQATDYALQIQQELIETKELIGDEFSWLTQASQYTMQGQQYLTEATQLAAFVRDPSLGAAMGLLNKAGLGSSLPVNPMAMMSLVNGFSNPGSMGLPQIAGVLGQLSQFSGAAYTKNHVYTPTDGSWDSTQLISNANNIAGAQGAYAATTNDLQTHAAALQALRDHLATATTPKDVQDTQAQIALEQAWTANEAAQMAAVKASFDSQKDNAEQRDNEAMDQSFDNFIAKANALPWQ